jgi:hypothetical protein
MLTREQILASKPKVKKIEVKELGGEIYIRQLTAKDQDEMERNHLKDGRYDYPRVLNAIYAICDENGERMFSEKDFDEVAQIPGKALMKVLLESADFSDISDDSVKDKAKN